MRVVLLALVLFVHSIGIAKADPNIYGPGGANLGPNGNPLTQIRSESEKINTQSMSISRDDQFVEGNGGDGYAGKFLCWREHHWTYIYTDDQGQNVAQKGCMGTNIAENQIKSENQELAYNKDEANNSDVVELNINLNSEKQNFQQEAINPIQQGAINPYTGEYYAPAGNAGYVGTRDGTFYAPAGPNGVINTRTGMFIPTH